MKYYMEFITISKVLISILGPLIYVCHKYPIGIVFFDPCPKQLQYCVGLREVLVDCTIPFDEERDRIQEQAVYAGGQPKRHGSLQLTDHTRVIEVEVGLMGGKSVPVIGPCHRIPRPVRLLGVEKDNPRFWKFLIRVAPHVKIPHR